jgi:hypothetical protein
MPFAVAGFSTWYLLSPPQVTTLTFSPFSSKPDFTDSDLPPTDQHRTEYHAILENLNSSILDRLSDGSKQPSSHFFKQLIVLGEQSIACWEMEAFLRMVENLLCLDEQASLQLVTCGIIPLLVELLGRRSRDLVENSVRCLCRLKMVSANFRNLIIQNQGVSVAAI